MGFNYEAFKKLYGLFFLLSSVKSEFSKKQKTKNYGLI